MSREKETMKQVIIVLDTVIKALQRALKLLIDASKN